MKSNNLASDRYLDNPKRFDQQQGFSDEQQCDQVIIPKQQTHIQQFSSTMSKPKAQIRYHEPRLKLTLLNPQKNTQQSIKEKLHIRQSYNTPKKHFMSLEMKKKSLKNQTTGMNSFDMLIKTKRTMIGDNIQSKDYCEKDIKALKNYVSNTGGQVCYEKKFQSNTHGHLKSLIEQLKKISNQDNFFFLKSKYNASLRQKINTSFVMPKKNKSFDSLSQTIEFSGEFESANLQFTAKVDEDEYDVYMSIDTNTKGHQNWFYFRVRNNSDQPKTIKFNVCNLKRQFSMFNKGVKVFIKKLDGIDNGDFRGDGVKIRRDFSPLSRGYQLSFNYQLQPQSWYEMSLLPPLTYSSLLRDIQQKQQHPNLNVDIMTYSLAGLAIPIITIGKEPVGDRNVILISGRIHPGQTVGSFVVKGIIEKLLQQSEFKEFFQNNVVKIVPMLNPDGVIFGNFRTNYLGTDLNRAFNTNDQILYPEIYALKQYAKELKQKYKNKFVMFLDIHGHSSKKNIFSYGPDYQVGNPNFYLSRLFPKILHSKSKYFKYNYCSFKLEQYKKNTARGFFLNELGVISYTVQTSYGLYDDSDKQYTFKINDWLEFGAHLADSLTFTLKLLNIGAYKTHHQIKKMISQSQKQQLLLIKKINKDIKKQQLTKKQKPSQQTTRQSNEINSDAESQQEDLNETQRLQLEKKVAEVSIPQFMLPRMYKPAIVYPTGTPRLLQFNQKQEQITSNIKILYPKRLKYNALRSMNISSTSTTLSRQIQRLQVLKPFARNIKLEKRVQF